MATKKTKTNLPTTIEECIGRSVLVRDNMAGVHCGELVALDLSAGTWTMRNARQIHYWHRASATAGIAVHGPGPQSRVTPALALIAGRALVSVAPLSDEAALAIAEYPEWRP